MDTPMTPDPTAHRSREAENESHRSPAALDLAPRLAPRKNFRAARLLNNLLIRTAESFKPDDDDPSHFEFKLLRWE